jgi:hypothetical protein
MTGPLRELRDREAIKELKARYFYAVDTHDWDLLAQVFAAGGTFHSASLDRPVTGRDAILVLFRSLHDGGFSVHHGHNPQITFTGPDTASAIWAYDDRIHFSDGQSFHGFGHYYDEYARSAGDAGRWEITSCRPVYSNNPLPGVRSALTARLDGAGDGGRG